LNNRIFPNEFSIGRPIYQKPTPARRQGGDGGLRPPTATCILAWIIPRKKNQQRGGGTAALYPSQCSNGTRAKRPNLTPKESPKLPSEGRYAPQNVLKHINLGDPLLLKTYLPIDVQEKLTV
jgi:hypothetical protein